MTPVVYLHGFASSPDSTKARFFARRFAQCDVPFETPRLDEGDFHGLTITGQLKVIERACGDRRVVLMGSSLGGYLAALFAARHPQVERLVLMAPAFDAAKRWRERMSIVEIERWRREGSFPFFHYGEGQEKALSYGFLEDLEHYEGWPMFRQPALVFHGRQDSVVPIEATEAFAARHMDVDRNVDVRALDSGHELTDVLDVLWEDTARFLDLRNRCPVLE